jgi:hypothetical protein
MDEIDLLPAEGAQLGGSQPVPEGQQDHGCIPMPLPVPARRLHEPLDLSLGEVLAGAGEGSTRSAIEESTQALATAAQLRNRRL